MRLGAALALLLTTACTASTSLERRADVDAGNGQWNQALASYRTIAKGTSSGRILSKLGAAALRAGSLGEAVNAYARMGREDPSRRAEAADGLELVARAAERTSDTTSLRLAIQAILDAAPERPVGRYVLALASRHALGPADRLLLTPAAVAAAPDADTADSLLLLYAADLESGDDCARAAGVYQAVALRTTLRPRATRARGAYQDCALRLGTARLRDGAPGDALAWLEGAIRADSASASGVAALEAMARALTALGDTVGGSLVQAVAERYRAALPDSGARH